MGAVAFKDIITFTRASGAGRFNAQGVYEWLPADQPRFDFDPVTKAGKGLLVEEQRTNLLTYSNDFANAAWNKANATITSGFISPSGSSDAYVFVEPGLGSVSPRVSRPTSLSAGAHTFTFYAKAGLRQWTRATISTGSAGNDIWFDISSGAVGGTSIIHRSLGAVGSIDNIGNGWFRCRISFTAEAGNTYTNIAAANVDGGVFYAPTGGAAIYVWGAQLEEGSFPTSYIPTTNAQVTRAADVPSVDTITPWYRPEQGTLVASAQQLGISNGAPRLVQISQPNQFIEIQALTGHIVGNRFVDGSYTGGINTPLIAGTPFTAAFAWERYGNAGLSVNGSTTVSRNDGTAPILDSTARLHIGKESGTTRMFNGHIKSLRYYPRRLSDAELQAVTA